MNSAEGPVVRSVRASDHVAPDGDIVESAVLAAQAAAKALDDAEAIEIDFRHVRGASSSYFNELLAHLVEKHAVTAVEARVRFVFSSGAQETVFRRSFAALRKQQSPQ